MVAALPVEVQALFVPLGVRVRGAPGEAGERADVQRVEVQLLRLPGEGGVQGGAPRGRGLAVDSVDEVDVEDGDAGLADPAERGFDVGTALGAYGGPCLRVDEALDADAETGGAALGEDGKTVGGRGGGRSLDGEGDGAQVGAHALLGDVAEPGQLVGGEEGRCAAAERRVDELDRAVVAVAEGFVDGGGLAVECVEVAAGEAVGRSDAGEEVAETAADLAERYVQVEGERALVLAAPEVAQGGPVGQRAVGGLVGVGVDVALVGADLVTGDRLGGSGGCGRGGGGRGGRGPGAGGEGGGGGGHADGSRKKWAYGTVHTASWARRWPV